MLEGSLNAPMSPRRKIGHSRQPGGWVLFQQGHVAGSGTLLESRLPGRSQQRCRGARWAKSCGYVWATAHGRRALHLVPASVAINVRQSIAPERATRPGASFMPCPCRPCAAPPCAARHRRQRSPPNYSRRPKPRPACIEPSCIAQPSSCCVRCCSAPDATTRRAPSASRRWAGEQEEGPLILQQQGRGKSTAAPPLPRCRAGLARPP